MNHQKEFVIENKKNLYQGFFKLERYQVKHTLYEGGWSHPVIRELFRRGSCIAVLLYDPDQDQVVLIEQFRIGAVLHSGTPWLLEIVAGAIEVDETAEAAAYRESLEEVGCEIQELHLINEFYTTPGGASERISLFCGKVDTRNIGGLKGLKEEDEDILVRTVSFDEAYNLIASGKINSAIPIIAIQWLSLNKTMINDLFNE